MMTGLLIVCSLIWVPVLLYQIGQRGFLILIVWLFIAPVASNVVNRPQANPFLRVSTVEDAGVDRKQQGEAYIRGETTIRLGELLEPNRLLFGAYLLVFGLHAFTLRRLPVPLDRTENWMAVFSLILVASALLQSTRTAFSLRVATDAFIVPFLSYMVARRYVSTEDSLGKLIKVVGYLGFYVVLICFIERWIHPSITYRLSGPFPKRDALYIVMMVVFFAALVDWLISSSRDRKSVLPYGVQICLLASTPLIVLFTWTRGVWLGFLLGIWTFAFLGRNLVMWRRKLLILGLVLGLLPVAVVGFQQALGEEEVYSRVANIRNIYGRLATYRIMMNEMSSNPVFGIGLNNVRDLLAEEKESAYGMRSYSVSHNSYLSLGTELGAIGIVAYLVVVGSIVGTGVRIHRMGKYPQDRWRGIGVVAIMIAYLIPAAFDSTLYQTWVSHVYVFVYVGAIAGLYCQKPLEKPVIQSRQSRESAVLTPSAVAREARNSL